MKDACVTRVLFSVRRPTSNLLLGTLDCAGAVLNREVDNKKHKVQETWHHGDHEEDTCVRRSMEAGGQSLPAQLAPGVCGGLSARVREWAPGC